MPREETREPDEQHERTPWHALSGDEALDRLETSRDGLAEDDVRRRLEEYGPNQLRREERRPWWKRLLAQFNNVLIIILLIAGALTTTLGQWVDAIAIFAVVLINAAIGFIQEGKAESALESIKGMLSPQATVTRDGRRTTIPAEEVVPGDIVSVSSGDRVPADIRLLEARRLRTQEAALTGESEPVDKDTDPVADRTDLADRASMAFAGTMVAQGTGDGVVVETGQHTEIGRISELLQEVEQIETPLLRQLDRFAKVLAIAIIAVAAAMAAYGIFVHGWSFQDMFLAAVGLAVAAIPQGLPALVTITLALGVQRMAKRNAIIRRLPAVETLGSISTIFTDKTGTLTRNEMTAQVIALADGEIEVTGVGFAPEGEFRRGGHGEDGGEAEGERIAPQEAPLLERFLMAGLLCNEAGLERRDGDWGITGDPTEGALVVAAAKAGWDPEEVRGRANRVDAIPFESERKYMATLDEMEGGERVIHVKGAPEVVLGMCSRLVTADGETELDGDAWQQQVKDLSNRGVRVLAVAEKPAGDQADLGDGDVGDGLALLGLVGLLDPPREAAIEAVAKCRSAGIRVKMITGDHVRTARAVAWQLGLSGPDGGEPPALTGSEIDRLDLEGLRSAALSIDVFARTTPAHKLHLVEALQAADEVVAMTGDGINDAPALKRADVGVAMGHKGTQAASEAAEMVLADDNFASIASAVEEGRTAYDNIRKAILFILPTNGGQAMTILLAVALGWMLPITPLQILWVNMVTAVTLALALAFERTEPGVMARPPRLRHEPLLSAFLVWRITFVSLLLLVGTFGLFSWYRAQGLDIETARAIAVNTLVVGEAVYLLNSRRIYESALTRASLAGIGLPLAAIAAVLAIQLPFTYWPPMQLLFGTAGLAPEHWGQIAAFSVALFMAVEAEKALVRRLAPPRREPARATLGGPAGAASGE